MTQAWQHCCLALLLARQTWCHCLSCDIGLVSTNKLKVQYCPGLSPYHCPVWNKASEMGWAVGACASGLQQAAGSKTGNERQSRTLERRTPLKGAGESPELCVATGSVCMFPGWPWPPCFAGSYVPNHFWRQARDGGQGPVFEQSTTLQSLLLS